MLEFFKNLFKKIAIGLAEEIKTGVLPMLADEAVKIIEENLKGEKRGDQEKRSC